MISSVERSLNKFSYLIDELLHNNFNAVVSSMSTLVFLSSH